MYRLEGRAPARSGAARPKKVQMENQEKLLGKNLGSESARARSQKQQKKRRGMQRRTRGSASLAPAERLGPIISRRIPLHRAACYVRFRRKFTWLECSRFERDRGCFRVKLLLLLGLGLSLCLATLAATAAGLLRPAVDFPLPVDSYHDQQIPSLFGKLTGRIQREPLNLVATIIFFGAIVHTFLAARFRKIAHNYQQSYEAIEYLLHATDGPPDFGKKHDKLLFRAQLFYFMGEVEAVFGVWLIPLFRCDYCVPRMVNDG